MPDFPMTCFSMYDDHLAIVETFHSEITTHDPRGVGIYLSKFAAFDAAALYEDDMRALTEGIRDELFQEQESA
ncbi:hypothetical protein [Kitasatospora sp. NPDC088351]|uniref:hypothetical protein n=1 Tax=Kitasatospora sp. NPDC088351 TaxID=3155180 RepID=UPI0034482153